MRTRPYPGSMARTLLAAALAIIIGLTGSGAAARAADGRATAKATSFDFDWTSLVITAAALLFGGGGASDAAIRAAVQEIKNAIDQSRTEIINHMDAIAAADVQACARSATIEFTDIDNLPTPVLILWAQNATGCATLATSYANTLTSPQAVDNIGAVVGPLFAIVLAARAKARLVNGTALVLQDEIRAYEGVVARDIPSCIDKWQTWPDPEWVFYTEHRYSCTAFNGEGASWVEYYYGSNLENPIDYTYVFEYPMRNTARPIAQQALPRLRAALP